MDDNHDDILSTLLDRRDAVEQWDSLFTRWRAAQHRRAMQRLVLLALAMTLLISVAAWWL